jgi:hypothetical protein
MKIPRYHSAPDAVATLDVTLAYLNGKDAESEEAQEHATAVAWHCTHKAKDIHDLAE